MFLENLMQNSRKSETFLILISKAPGALITQNTVMKKREQKRKRKTKNEKRKKKEKKGNEEENAHSIKKGWRRQ